MFLEKKNIESIKDSRQNSNLIKNLSAVDLVLIGLGSIIGSGVFVLTGIIAARYSGPAIMISYIIAGIVCIFIAMSYSELATMLPTSGSLYNYSYLAFGEIFAYLTAGILVLELIFGAATVACGWSAYIFGLLESLGIVVPKYLSKPLSEGGGVNIFAVGLVLFCGTCLCLGTKDVKRLNFFFIIIKFVAVIVFIIAATPHFKIQNWNNFMPFGFDNVLIGGSILFFAYTGFTNIPAVAEECKNPEKDIFTGIIVSLLTVVIIYVIMACLVTGVESYTELDTGQPLAQVLRKNGSNIASMIVAIGAVLGMTSVVLLLLYSTSRIFYVISKDGLMPTCFSVVKNGNPYYTVIIFTCLTAILAGFFSIGILGQMSSIGALIDYTLASTIVILLRKKFPNIKRPFKCPLILCKLGFIISCYLLFKQLFNQNYTISTPGKYLILWLSFVIIFYLIRKCLIKKQKSLVIK